MKLKIFGFILLLLTLLIIRLPASWMDALISHLTAGQLRLASPEGTFWHGHGILALADNQQYLHASKTINWSFQLHPTRFGALLALDENQQPQARLGLTPNGMTVEQLALDLPLNLLAATITHPAAKAGWRGRLLLDSNGFGCNWQQQCEGSLILHWMNAGLDIVPERELGSHQIQLQALGRIFDIEVTTLEGDIQLKGAGRLTEERRVELQATIEGDPNIIDRIPNVMHQNAERSDKPGRVHIHFP